MTGRHLFISLCVAVRLVDDRCVGQPDHVASTLLSCHPPPDAVVGGFAKQGLAVEEARLLRQRCVRYALHIFSCSSRCPSPGVTRPFHVSAMCVCSIFQRTFSVLPTKLFHEQFYAQPFSEVSTCVFDALFLCDLSNVAFRFAWSLKRCLACCGRCCWKPFHG